MRVYHRLFAVRAAPSLAVVLVVASLVGCGGGDADGTWELPNGDLAGTRAAAGSPIDAGNVSELEVRWRYRLTAKAPYSGAFASTPVADETTVYVQDLESNVHALDRATGKVRWVRRYRAPNEGPNGLAVDRRRVYGATDSDAFALSAATGRQLWSRHLTSATEQFVDIAPVVWEGLVFTSTIGFPPGGQRRDLRARRRDGRRALEVRHDPGPVALPVRGRRRRALVPGLGRRAGAALRGDRQPGAMGRLAAASERRSVPRPGAVHGLAARARRRTGRLLWHDQVTPHDVRDYDFQATPILATVEGDDLVFGAGKAGRVIAWDRETRQRRWETAVGLHRNDLGPLPRRRVTVCPGLLGGVETPMAYAEGRLFVPVVDLCGWGSATPARSSTSLRPARGKGRLVALDAATGRALWVRRCPRPTSAARRSRTTSSSRPLRRDRLRVRRRRREARLAHAACGPE